MSNFYFIKVKPRGYSREKNTVAKIKQRPPKTADIDIVLEARDHRLTPEE